MGSLLGILGLADLATVPFMIAAHHHSAGERPVPAIVAEVIIGIAALASAVGLRQGRRRAFGVAITCRSSTASRRSWAFRFALARSSLPSAR